jgi:nicotinamidase-related amidase
MTSPLADDPVALIVVDVQEGFITDETRPIVPRITKHLRHARARYAAVIATRFVNVPGSLYVTERDWGEMMAEPSTRLLECVSAHADLVLTKHGLAPDREELMTALGRVGAEHVELCGFDTDQCVLATAVLLWDRGIAPRVLAPLCASSGGPDMHEAGLSMLRRAIGDRNVIDATGRPA